MIECALAPSHQNQCVIGLLYSAGLQVQELVALQRADIDIDQQLIHVLNPRTKRRRSIPLSGYLILYLKKYRRCYTGNQKLFQGYKNQECTPRAVQQIVARAACSAGIERKVTPSMLRNSFAIHLLQSGTRPDIVKNLLGLESDQSMQKYVMAANRAGVSLKSPLG